MAEVFSRNIASIPSDSCLRGKRLTVRHKGLHGRNQNTQANINYLQHQLV